jgi:Peptidase family M28
MTNYGKRRKSALTLISAFLSFFLITVPAAGRIHLSVGSDGRELSPTEQQLAKAIKVETIREVVTDLSADEMEGRGTAQTGGDRAGDYLAKRFAKLGLKPLGSRDSYFQPIKFRDFEFLPDTTLRIGDQSLKMGSDFVVMPPYSGDKSVSGSLVFIAYGMLTKTPNRNDLAGLDVKGKMVVMLEGPPVNVSRGAWKKAQIQVEILQYLVGKGAAGIIIISHGREAHPYSEFADYLVRRQVERADVEEYPPFMPPFLSLSDEGADKLFAKAGISRKDALARAEREGFAPIDLKQSAKLIIHLKKGKGTGNNVIGVLEGSDSNLKSEAIVFSAHYDAYGISADKRIYHGAADNGLGVGEMMAVAEALCESPTKPKRSIIFLAVTGEEYGGLGSDYWVHNPTWKIKQTAADLNLDGMGTEVYGPVKVLVGYGAEHSTLGSVLNEVAGASGLSVIADPMPDENSFYRSDHYFFVKKGVPGLMVLGAPEGTPKAWIDRMKQWEKTDYHQPTDTIRPDWNWDGPRTIAVVFILMGFRIANDDQSPTWLSSSPFNRERGTNATPPPEP